jgi:hypothetical protein
VLEVNAEHALVKKLDGSVHFNDLAHILFDQALLAEGGLPDDPAAYVAIRIAVRRRSTPAAVRLGVFELFLRLLRTVAEKTLAP